MLFVLKFPLITYEQFKFKAQLSWVCKHFLTSGPAVRVRFSQPYRKVHVDKISVHIS